MLLLPSMEFLHHNLLILRRQRHQSRLILVNLITVGFSDVTVAKALEENLKASGVPSEVHIYPGCGHTFMNMLEDGIKRRKSMGLPDESPEAVKLAWSRFCSWMKNYLF